MMLIAKIIIVRGTCIVVCSVESQSHSQKAGGGASDDSIAWFLPHMNRLLDSQQIDDEEVHLSPLQWLHPKSPQSRCDSFCEELRSMENTSWY